MGTYQGYGGYRSGSGYRSGTGYRLGSYIYKQCKVTFRLKYIKGSSEAMHVKIPTVYLKCLQCPLRGM